MVTGCPLVNLESRTIMTTLKLIGTYRVSVSEEELRFITEKVTGSAEWTREEVSGLALLEVEVRGAPEGFARGEFHQAGSDQVAYDERYFSVDGLELIGSDPPGVADFRVCFFLHYFDPSKGISSPYGDLPAGSLREMPERLAKICVYQHPG
jgi:hypothetical protein